MDRNAGDIPSGGGPAGPPDGASGGPERPGRRRRGDGEDTPAFLGLLLARDEPGGGSGGLEPDLLARLDTALLHRTELHALRQRREPRGPVGHRTVRHVFLLADGGYAVLWEVEHNAFPDGGTHHHLYPDRLGAEAFVRQRFGEPPLLDSWPGTGGTDADALDPGALEADPPEPDAPEPRTGAPGDAATGAAGERPGTAESGARPGPPSDPALWRSGPQGRWSGRPARRYESHDPPGHARRLLRRAENADRPGGTVRRLLTTAVGYETVLVALRHDLGGEYVMEWALYEHAFLLADGSELSLWELEHSLSQSGVPVCEVYLDQAAARDSVDRHRAGS